MARPAGDPLPDHALPHSTSRETAHPETESFVKRRRKFFSSVRFDITAWSAAMLILMLALLGIGLRTMLLRSLESEGERRLFNAATEVSAQFRSSPHFRTLQDQTAEDPKPSFNIDSVLVTGVSVTVVDIANGETVFQSGPIAALWPPDTARSDLLALRDTTYFTTSVNDIAIRGLVMPVISDTVRDPISQQPAIVGMVFTSESQATTNAVLAQLNQLLLLAGVIGGVISSFGGWSLAGRALAPVNRIIRSAEEISNEREVTAITRRLVVPQTGDEIAQLAETFNHMLDSLEDSFQAQRRFVADASHELRTPITSIKGNVDVLLRQLSAGRDMNPDDLKDALGDVSRETARIGRLVDDLLSLARNEADALTTNIRMNVISLDIIAEEAFRTAEALVNGQTMELDAPTSVTLHGDGDRLVQVMLILLDNALRHTPPGGTVILATREAVDPRDQIPCAQVIVSDTGAGIEAEHLPHLFERFYRADGHRTRATGGTGLGLSIALAIVRAHGGWIDVESLPGEGTTFTVWIPKDERLTPPTRERGAPRTR